MAGLTAITDSEYNSLSPQQWPVVQKQQEVVHQRMFTDRRYFTDDHRANFIAVKHLPPQATTSKVFPLVLNTGRSRDQWHTMTRTGLSTRLAEHATEPYVLMHPKTAMQYDICDGEMVTVFNSHGECVVKAMISDSMKPGELFVPIHWNEITGPLSKPCVLVDARTDNLSGQPEFKYTPVDIRTYDFQTSATVLVREAIVFDNVGYVARQKVEGGYLYRIRTPMEMTDLQQKIESLLTHTRPIDKQISRDDPLIKGMIIVIEKKVASLYKLTKGEPSSDEVQALSELFTKSVDDDFSLHAVMGN